METSLGQHEIRIVLLHERSCCGQCSGWQFLAPGCTGKPKLSVHQNMRKKNFSNAIDARGKIILMGKSFLSSKMKMVDAMPDQWALL
jgi:hypothetical protein